MLDGCVGKGVRSSEFYYRLFITYERTSIKKGLPYNWNIKCRVFFYLG